MSPQRILQHSERLRALHPIARYGGTLALVGAALLLRMMLALPAAGFHYLMFLPVIIAVAFFAGRGPAIAATVASAALVYGVFMRDHRYWAGGDQILSNLIFVAIGVTLAILMDRLQWTMVRLHEMQIESRKGEREKDLLLRELGHRIRNDLSNVAALLRVQADGADEGSRPVILSAASRVQVLARMHDRLSLQDGRTVVNLREFLTDLCSDLQIALVGERPVMLRSEIASLQAEASRAVSFGLVVNELVTNSIKYAFPDRQGTVSVELGQEDDRVVLSVADDGIGFARDRSPSGRRGSGRGLVEALARQVGGVFECESTSKGTKCTLVAPASVLIP